MQKNIIAYRADNSACFTYRLRMPLYFLGKNHADYKIQITGFMDTRMMKWDLAILQRQHTASVFDNLKYLRANKCKLVYEMDDYVLGAVPKWNPAYSTWGRKDIQDNVKAFLSEMDALFVSTEYLKKVYSQYCEHIYVLPNGINFDLVEKPPNNSRRRVVLWQGSQTHEKDVSILNKSLKLLAKDPDVLIKLWKLDLRIPEAYLAPFCRIEDFYPMLSQMDATIGLAPLVPNPFNRAKSNLKVLEYWANGIVAIASNFGPYAETIENGVDGFLVSNNNDWYDVIRYMLDNESVRNEVIQNAMIKVRTKFDIQKNYLLWKNAIDEILERK